VSEVEIVVIKTPGGDVDLRCGGSPMTEDGAGASTSGLEGNVELGKRYVDAGDTLEVLCTKAGPGDLSVGTETLVLKSAKPLPSSD
jgi:hypothetical protein